MSLSILALQNQLLQTGENHLPSVEMGGPKAAATLSISAPHASAPSTLEPGLDASSGVTGHHFQGVAQGEWYLEPQGLQDGLVVPHTPAEAGHPPRGQLEAQEHQHWVVEVIKDN